MTTNVTEHDEEIALKTPSQTGGDSPSIEKEAPVMRSTVLDREDPEFLAKAHGVYAELRAHGPVVRAPFGRGLSLSAEPGRPGMINGEERLFVSRYKEASAALLDDRLSSDFRVGLTAEQRQAINQFMPEELKAIIHSLLMLDPPDHTRLRRLVQPSFSPRAMEALKPRIQRIVDDLLDKAERQAAERGEAAPDRRMNLIESFTYPMPVTVISDMLGIPTEDRERVHAWAENLLNTERRERMMDEETRAGLKAFAHYLEELFERKRRETADDMISQMILAQEDGDRLNHQELLSMVFILFFAGHVTTVNLIGNGVVALLTHPDQHAQFLANPTRLSKGMVEETLRYWGPIDYISNPRIVKEDFTLGGTHIPKGSKLSMGLASANRDPELFANPDVYDISRPDAHKNIAFGKGIHLCIGAPLARIEAQIAFETLFQRFPKLRLAVPAEELRWGGGAGMRGFNRLPVLF